MSTTRPLRADERAYLQEYKASLEEALRAFWLTLGLFGLPIGFLLSTLAGGHGFRGDRLATVLAGIIILLFVGIIVSYSPRGVQGRRLRPADFGLPGRIELDLLAGDVEERELTVDAKRVTSTRWPRGETTQRRYFIQAGGREVEVTGLRWMNLLPGQPIELAVAPRSGLALAVGGLRERLPMPTARRKELQRADEGTEEEGANAERGSLEP